MAFFSLEYSITAACPRSTELLSNSLAAFQIFQAYWPADWGDKFLAGAADAVEREVGLRQL